eukprot:4237194-Pyramimonas_sp.AAC.1
MLRKLRSAPLPGHCRTANTSSHTYASSGSACTMAVAVFAKGAPHVCDTNTCESRHGSHQEGICRSSLDA